MASLLPRMPNSSVHRFTPFSLFIVNRCHWSVFIDCRGILLFKSQVILGFYMDLSYKKLKAERVGDAEVEYWHAFREIAQIVYRTETAQIEFPAEWLGWDRWRGNWLSVLLPAKIDGHELHSVASQIHLSLCSMKIRNVVSVQTAPAAETNEDRESTLQNFTKWMSNHAWRVTVTTTSTLCRTMKIERRGL